MYKVTSSIFKARDNVAHSLFPFHFHPILSFAKQNSYISRPEVLDIASPDLNAGLLCTCVVNKQV